QAQEAKRAVDQVIALSDHEIVRAAQQQTTESYTKVGEQYLAGVQAKRIEQAKVQAREVADQREELTSLSVEHVERIEDENNVRRDAAEQAVAARKAEHAIIQQARLGSTEYIKPVIVAPEAPKLEAPDISPTILQEASSVSDLVEKAQTEAAKANKQVRQQTQVQEAKRAVDQAIALSDHEIVRAAQQQTTESYTKVGEQYLAGVQAKRIEQAKAQAREVADQRAELTSLSVERLERIEDENNVRRDAAEQAVAARKAEHAIIQEARLGSAEYIKPVIVAPEVPKLEAPDISPTILGDSSPVSDVVEQARVEAGQINKQAIIARLEVRAQGQEQALLGNVGALADAYLEDVDGQEKLAKDEADLVAYIQRDEMMLEQAKGERALADAWQAQEAAQELEALIQEACLGSGKYTESENWTPERDYRVGSDISPTILKESAPVSDLVDSERMAAAKANKEAIVAHLQIRAHKQEQTALYNVGKLADEYQEIVNGQAQDFVNRRKELIYVPSENVEYVSDEDNVRRSAAVEIQGQADVIAVGQVHTLIEDYKKTRATEAVAEQEQLGRYNKALDVVLMDKAEQGFFDDLESDGWRLVAQIKHDEALLEQEKSGIKFEQPKTEWTSDSALWDAAAEGDQQLVNEQAWDAADWGYGLEKWLAEQDELDKQEVTTFWTNFDTLIHMNKQKSQTGWTAYFWDSTTQLWNTTRTRTAQSFVLLANALPAALLVGATGGGALYVQWDTPQVKKARKISVDYMDRMRNGVQEMRETVAYWMVRGNERARAACASGTVVLKNKADVVAEYVIYAASVGKETTQRVGGILYKYVQQAKEVVSKSRMGQGLSNAAEYAAKKIHMD
ncbi:MAG TPA: hypothetical protein VGT41_00150, partial [Candidatus Babeliales bacterium]|nr:hypothetical protein [Candidatus Babeliales bacterium]